MYGLKRGTRLNEKNAREKSNNKLLSKVHYVAHIIFDETEENGDVGILIKVGFFQLLDLLKQKLCCPWGNSFVLPGNDSSIPENRICLARTCLTVFFVTPSQNDLAGAPEGLGSPLELAWSKLTRMQNNTRDIRKEHVELMACT